MAETKHTPGPWEACDQGDYSDFDGNSRVILGDDMRIAVVQWSPRNDNENAEGPWSDWVSLAKAILEADQKARALPTAQGEGA